MQDADQTRSFGSRLIWKSAVFAVAVAAALGFGAAQAFAAPQAPAENHRRAPIRTCRKICGELGGNWVP